MTLTCPECKSSIAREGQRFCYRCGHDLRAYYDSLNIQIKETRPVPDSREADTDEQEAAKPEAEATGSEIEQPAPAATDPIEMTAETVLMPAYVELKGALRILLPTGDIFDRELAQNETQIGKGPRNDIVISDPAVSTTHAIIKSENGSFIISDLGSRNGTYVNGERLSGPRKLQHGDVVGVGLSKLTFRLSQQGDTGAILTADVGPPGALKEPVAVTEQMLADAVVKASLITRQDLDRLLETKGRSLYRALIDERVITEEKLRNFMSLAFALPTVELAKVEVAESLAATFPSNLARERAVFPLSLEPAPKPGSRERLQLAMADPTDAATIEEISQQMQADVEIKLATPAEINEQVARHYGPKLIGVLPSGETLEYSIRKNEVEIGKAPHNDIVLTDQTVSNTHAILITRDGAYSIVDLGSRNGTFVNGERLGTQARPLSHGDSIQLGQTVLTFRNPGEIRANITASLSVESLEEIKVRAQLANSGKAPAQAGGPRPPSPEIPITPGAIPPASNIAPGGAPAALAAPVDATPDKDKAEKKKKKDKKDDRLRAAYVGAVSRVIAQVVAALLSVVLALYVVQRSMSPQQQNPPADPNTTQKPAIKVATPGRTMSFVGPQGDVESSGVYHLPNSDKVFFVLGGHPSELFWMPINEGGQVPGTEVQSLKVPMQIADPEGMTSDGSFFYVVGSQSHADGGSSNALVRFYVDPAGPAVQGEGDTVTDLRGFLIENVPELKAASDKEGNAGGINIEGIAWEDSNNRLLLGLRSPLAFGNALVVPLKFNPKQFSRESLQLGGQPIPLSLEGGGIRDIQRGFEANTFYIISGPTLGQGPGGFALWEWKPSANTASGETTLRKMLELATELKPEGITPVRLAGREFLFIVGTGGRYMKIDLADGQ
jgi:pSer/pThr/pTyr-binding forkhead associated (FHA) protein